MVTRASTAKEAQARCSIDGSRPLLQSQTDGATSNKVCDRSDVRSTELLPVGPPTNLDVSETANVLSYSEMALFTDVVKRGKRKMKARAIAPPAVAVARKTGKSSAITGRGVGVGIQAAKRSGRLASVFASRLAPDLTDAGLKSYLDSELGLSVNVECVKATDWHTSSISHVDVKILQFS